MSYLKPTRRYEWVRAFEDMAMALAERAPTEDEFKELWTKLGDVVRYLVTNDPRQKENPANQPESRAGRSYGPAVEAAGAVPEVSQVAT